ncbi:ATP-binding protein [Bradyrhizobium sp.]|uniref:ATP-binding protein n=1 Tax=Bradyrhizobium sp. TaxID=376 RepID=UPI000AC88410|nr:ATP-binding protein [Bradyrhizobium sp.]
MSGLSSSQPYPGLRPFEQGDQDYFFGRETQTRGLRQKLDASRLVAVVGRSGCGKSSLVKAGLIPLLAKENAEGEPIWRMALFRPQGRPVEELGKALLELLPGGPNETRELRRSRLAAMLSRSSQGLVEAAGELGLPSSGRLLIIVDQFEEIFRFEDPSGRSADEATAFVRLLIEAISAETPRINVILTMRLDFLGDCARFQRLPEAISDGQYLVPNLSRAERRAAIEAPAKKAGKPIRPEVTQRLLNEVGEDPDQLPVLQHVLMRMWQHAGPAAEISLDDYTGAGGVKEAISRHADQIYGALPSDGHRWAAERLFKAISERDRRSRSIRRATLFRDIAAIIAGDNATTPAAASEKRLREVVEAFRAPNCCFLMPPAEQELTPDTVIDISHESLLRGWSKITGETGSAGWIAEEERDGRTYASLLEAAENESILPPKVAHQRKRWWDSARPNAAWARRYGNKFETVESFMRASATRAVVRRFAIVALIALAATAIVAGSLFYSYYRGGQAQYAELDARHKELDARHNRLTMENRENLGKLTQAQAQILAQEKELDKRSREVDQTIRSAQKSLPSGDQKARQDLDKLLKESSAGLDNVVQRAIIDPKRDNAPPSTLSRDAGFMWIGSAAAGNLTTPAGVPVLPGAVRLNEQYLTSLDIYLREGLPERPGYTQQATLGIMPEGTRVQIVSVAPPFQRPTGDQYWAQVRVVRLALSTVFFQFAGGAREQAQLLSRSLQEKGYKIPGEERTGAAAGKREVRYFYAGQKAIATQLAADTTQTLQRLGYPSLSVSAVLAADPTRSNLDGKLELWLELPPK